MEPDLVTAPHLLPILEELRSREPIFHHADIGASREVFEKMTAPEFWEVGASGRRYSREYVITTLVERYAEPHEDVWEASDFHCAEIAPDHYLVTYTLIQNRQRVTRRATLWRSTEDGWQIVYHQGTTVEQSVS
ncbi:MAG: DUF4440 domain-containing protein [Pseudomonadota bacterium]